MNHRELKLRTEPTLRDLQDLERLAERRSEVAAVAAADPTAAETRRFLLATLDQMEEELCLYGCSAPGVVEGWRRLSRFESFDAETLQSTDGGTTG